MREIKFRAWHNEKMCYFDLFITDWETMSIRDVIINGEPIMQFTGLKDKNSKEIYEGDLFWWNWHGSSILRVVEFVNSGFVARDVIDHIIPMEYLSNFPLATQVEVIGNIWESPELLKC